LCRDRYKLDFLKVVGQLEGCINLARGNKSRKMAKTIGERVSRCPPVDFCRFG
jgi:hypothetical protein